MDTKNNKIAVIAPEVLPIPPIHGGAVENGIHEVVKLLPQKVCVLTIGDPDLPQEETVGKVTFLRYQQGWLDKLLLCTYKLPFKNSNSFLYWMLYARWCARMCLQRNVKVIHVHNRWQFIPVLRKFNRNAKILFHVHQESACNFSERQAVKLEPLIDGFISCSSYITDLLKEKFFQKDDKKNDIAS